MQMESLVRNKPITSYFTSDSDRSSLVGLNANGKRPAVDAGDLAADKATRELKRAKALVAKLTKAAKQKTAEESFRICDTLVQWATGGYARLWEHMQEHNTRELQEICRDSGLKVAGAKYVLTQRISDHEDCRRKRVRCDTLREQANCDTDVTQHEARGELVFETCKTLEAATNLFVKHHRALVGEEKNGKLAKELQSLDLAHKIQYLAGMARGHDVLLLKAITGPRARHYNGKWGELAVESQTVLAGKFVDFLHDESERMSDQEWVAVCRAVHEKRPTAAYGMWTLALVGDMKCDELDVQHKRVECTSEEAKGQRPW